MFISKILNLWINLKSWDSCQILFASPQTPPMTWNGHSAYLPLTTSFSPCMSPVPPVFHTQFSIPYLVQLTVNCLHARHYNSPFGCGITPPHGMLLPMFVYIGIDNRSCVWLGNFAVKCLKCDLACFQDRDLILKCGHYKKSNACCNKIVCVCQTILRISCLNKNLFLAN